MTTRWMHPHELERQRERDRFDPIVEADRYGLSRDLALAIWERACTDATDRNGRCDTEQAKRRFHQIAARIAARGGRLRPDVGRLTRVGTEDTGEPVSAWRAKELIPRSPGRETLLDAEPRRSNVHHELDELAPELESMDAARSGLELPAAHDAIRAMAGWPQGWPQGLPPELADPTLLSQARAPLDPRLWAPPSRQPALLAAQMRRTFGATAGDISITADSTRPLAAGAEGVTVGEQVYIAPGYYDLTTLEGRERLGHEVAHVLQQRRGRSLPNQLRDGERAGLEAEADRAGQAFARGQRFAVQGRAPAQIALFKGAAPTTAPAGATTTTIDLKSGGRIARKPPAPKPAADGGTGTTSAAPTTPAKEPPKTTEKLVVSYGGVQSSGAFTIERNESGDAVRLVGSGKLSLPASKYIKDLELEISLGADGYVGAKVKGASASMIKIGGLTIQGGTLTAGIDHGKLNYALDGATISLPKGIGDGALSIQGNGDQEPAFDASLAIKVPKMHPATMTFHADAAGYRASGSTGVDIKQASGSVTFSLEKVGEDRALWSAAGSVGYTSERLSGQISVQYNADGELSGEGNLAFQIADFLTGQATVAVDKEGHVTVNGEIRPPAETQLFPEKKVENTFFHKSLEFPIWGISIPMVGSVGIIAFIEGSMGYRVGVGAGVMRGIVLSGTYSTDPSVQPSFQITGEIFIPAFAELLISIGGGVKLDAFIAEIGGGVKIDGRAGFYGGLSVRPTLAYEGGKYRLMGQALLAGDVGLSAQVDAFVKLHVGKWMFSWEKIWEWKLAEWNKWLGLNLGMEADIDYTLGQPLSPDIFKLKKPDSLDVQGIAKSAMPQSGMPPQGPKGAQNQKTEFKMKGGGGGAAPASAPAQPKVAGTPAGAAGHKNQDPKGTQVKPAAPPKPAPPKPAKGKGPGETGPGPKNKSKPSEQKLDAQPIVERFSMHGEQHQLIVQLGPSGHVDMASKRERLSVKVGAAVGKLTGKQAPPQQIADLKEIGALAKKGDTMVATAKLTDKEGTTKVAQKIAAYGNKWEVKDLDEVAIKAPRALVVANPVHLEKVSVALAKALASAQPGQTILNQAGDPKEVTRKVLDKHKDARFDYGSATLTLPSPKAGALQAAPSIDQLGQLLGQQTGVSKITLKKIEQNGEAKLELVGSIGVSASLGTIRLLVVFQPIKLRPAMSGGQEQLEVRPSAPNADGTAELWVANQKGAIRFDNIANGPIGKAKNEAGLRATNAAQGKIEALVTEVEAVKVTQGLVPQDKLQLLRTKAEKASAAVSEFGQKLKTNSLQGADHARPAKTKQPVPFDKPQLKDWKLTYVNKFTAEMVRQMRQQEDGLNKLSIDEWVVNREVFSPTQHLNEIDATAKQAVLDKLHDRCKEGLPRAREALEKKQKKKEALDAALKALQSGGAPKDELDKAAKKLAEAGTDVRKVQAEIQGYLDAAPEIATGQAGGTMDPTKMQGPGGREDGQTAWADKHRKAKEAIMKLITANDPLVSEWTNIVKEVGDLAVLHDPDQIAGGHGDIEDLPVVKEPTDPSDSDGHDKWRQYLRDIKAHLGVKDINGSLGSQWKHRIATLYDNVTNDPDNPQEAYAIRTMNVKFNLGS
jgi:Domain of unknown function (DUF4157)/Novel toxin 15